MNVMISEAGKRIKTRALSRENTCCSCGLQDECENHLLIGLFPVCCGMWGAETARQRVNVVFVQEVDKTENDST